MILFLLARGKEFEEVVSRMSRVTGDVRGPVSTSGHINVLNG